MTESAVSAAIPRAATTKWRPDTIEFAIGAVLICVTMIGADLGGNPYWIQIFRLLGIYLSISILLNFLYVDAGQTSFGQGAVLGAGAYMAAILTGLHGVPYPIAAVVGVFAAMVAGLLCALPALRVQQYYLGFVTFGVALVVPQMIVAFPDYTEGINGIPVPFPIFSHLTVGGVSVLSAMIAAVCCARARAARVDTAHRLWPCVARRRRQPRSRAGARHQPRLDALHRVHDHLGGHRRRRRILLSRYSIRRARPHSTSTSPCCSSSPSSSAGAATCSARCSAWRCCSWCPTSFSPRS